MDFNLCKSLLSTTQKALKEVDPFLKELYMSQQAHDSALEAGKIVRETVVLYFERTDKEYKGELVLEFLKKLIRNLSSTLNELEKTSLLLIQSKDVLSAKWSVYVHLASVLQKFPNATAKRIHFEMYNEIPDWEEFLEESSVHILTNLDDGLVNSSVLMENIESILDTINPKYVKNSPSKLAELSNNHKDCEKLNKEVSEVLSAITKRAQVLSEILENSFI